MSEKVSIQVKLKYLQNRIQKQCLNHKTQAILFCYKLNCLKCPYLCTTCIRQNNHGHNQQIYQFYQFIKKINRNIEQHKKKINNFLGPQQKDYQWIIKQQLKILQAIQILQKQIISIFQQSKKKIQNTIDKNLKKSKNDIQRFLKIYSNPNIFINKINSDNSFIFINQIKDILCLNQKNDIQGQINKNQVNQIKGKILQVINNTNGAILYNPKIINKKIQEIKVNPIFNIALPQIPLNIFASLQNIIVSLPKQTHCINILQKARNQILSSVNVISVCKSNLINDSSFIGLTSSNNILTYFRQKVNKIVINSKIISIGYIATYSKIYVLMGLDNGCFQALDVQTNQIVYQHLISSRKIIFIQIYIRNAMILCCRQDSTIQIYKYYHQYQSLLFSYQKYLSINLPNQFLQIQLMKINNNDLILFGNCRNIFIYDLMSNCQVIKTSYIQKASTFTHACIIQENQQIIILSLSIGQSKIYSWILDRNSKNMSVDPLLGIRDIRQEPIKGIELVNDNLWIIRQNQRLIQVYSLDCVLK